MKFFICVLLTGATLARADESYQLTNAPGFWAHGGLGLIHIDQNLSVSSCVSARDQNSNEVFLICEPRHGDPEHTGQPTFAYRPKRDRIEMVALADSGCAGFLTRALGVDFYLRVSETDVDKLTYRRAHGTSYYRRWTPPAGYRVLRTDSKV